MQPEKDTPQEKAAAGKSFSCRFAGGAEKYYQTGNSGRIDSGFDHRDPVCYDLCLVYQHRSDQRIGF